MKEDKKDKMAPQHEAKHNVLKHLSDSMKRHMGEGIKSHLTPKKVVSVEAPDSESLKKGLDLASHLAPKMDEMSHAAEDIIGDEEEPVDMDNAAEEHEEELNGMPKEHVALKAIHGNHDEENSKQMELLKKHLSKKG